jgi:BirA family biotin operon repressor/biotin-[acetyl-CoA-carboxylase] ligase
MYKIINFETLPSTNLYLKQNYHIFDEYTVITTDNQTNGRGRINRVWNSNKDDLTFSILLKPDIDSYKIPLISLIIGAAINKIIDKYIKSYIKWPNDILVNDKKLAGILVEGVFSEKIDAVIVGVGINVNTTEFPDNLIIKATSLKKELNIEIDKNELLTQIIEQFIYLYNEFLNGNDKYLDILKTNNYLKNKKVYINNNEVEVLDINNKGNLIIKENEEIKEIFFGEVTLEKIYNKE